jgi:DinB superfamily
MRIQQRELHRQLRDEAIATRERIAALLRPLDPAQVNEHPEPEGWSVGQVCEHLIIADELYEQPFADLLRRSRPDAAAGDREWKSSFIGGMIAESLLKPRKLKRPKVFDPGPTPRNGVVEALLAHEAQFVKVMDGAAQYDWRALRIGSPALPSWAPKMNVGDGFRIHVVHLTRHSRQIERLAGLLKKAR